MRKPYPTLLLLTVMSLCLMLFLHFTHKRENNSKNNGFNRTIVNNRLHLKQEIKLPVEATEFLGETNAGLVIYDDHSAMAYALNKQFDITKTYNIRDYIALGAKNPCYVNIKYDQLHCFSPNTKEYVQLNLSTNKTTHYTLPEIPNRVTAVNNHQFIARSFTQPDLNPVTKIFDSLRVAREKELVPSNGDHSGLTMDGLFFIEHDNSYYFMCYYRNKVYHFDSTLTVLDQITTVDTNTVCKNVVAKFGPNTYYFQGNISVVNKKIAVNDDRVFIFSLLRADNQDKKEYYNSGTIDMYSKANGTYLGSVELPNYKGEKVINIYCQGNKLFALFYKQLKVYEIN